MRTRTGVATDARLLPYLDRQVTYNEINWWFGARWSDGDKVYTDHNPPDDASGGNDSIPQMSVLTQQIATFLCPSDFVLIGLFLLGGVSKRVGASNYAGNIGLNRRISGGKPDVSWLMNGPNYVASSWDKTVSNTSTMATFKDGASNTAIFSEWIKGQAEATGRAQNGLSEV